MKDVEFTTRSRELPTGAHDQEPGVTVENAEATNETDATTEVAEGLTVVSMLRDQLPAYGCER